MAKDKATKEEKKMTRLSEKMKLFFEVILSSQDTILIKYLSSEIEV